MESKSISFSYFFYFSPPSFINIYIHFCISNNPHIGKTCRFIRCWSLKRMLILFKVIDLFIIIVVCLRFGYLNTANFFSHEYLFVFTETQIVNIFATTGLESVVLCCGSWSRGKMSFFTQWKWKTHLCACICASLPSQRLLRSLSNLKDVGIVQVKVMRAEGLMAADVNGKLNAAAHVCVSVYVS